MFSSVYFESQYFTPDYFPSIEESSGFIGVLTKTLSAPELSSTGSLLLIGILTASLSVPSIQFRSTILIPTPTESSRPVFHKGRLVVGKKSSNGNLLVFHKVRGVSIRTKKAPNEY